MGDKYCSKLAPLSVAFASAVVMALGTILLGWGAMYYNIGNEAVRLIGTVYKGYGPTFVGAAWGALWAFIEGFVAGLLFAWLYNLCASCAFCRPKGESRSGR